MSREFLRERRESLEEEFFHKLQTEQIARLRDELDRKQTRQELRASSGISDDALLDRLVELGMGGGTLAALSMVPLVHVAWCGGAVQDKERAAVLKAAHESGIDEGGAAHAVLDSWLARKPSAQLFEAWAAYTRALAGKLSAQQRDELRDQIAGQARRVAEAAGGFLGVHRVSKEEEAALARIRAAFAGEPTA
jgi:hypothetical protein